MNGYDPTGGFGNDTSFLSVLFPWSQRARFEFLLHGTCMTGHFYDKHMSIQQITEYYSLLVASDILYGNTQVFPLTPFCSTRSIKLPTVCLFKCRTVSTYLITTHVICLSKLVCFTLINNIISNLGWRVLLDFSFAFPPQI